MWNIIKNTFNTLAHWWYLHKFFTLSARGYTVYDPKKVVFTYVNDYVANATGYTKKQLYEYPVHKYAFDFEKTQGEIDVMGTKKVIQDMTKPRHFANQWILANGKKADMSWISVRIGSKIVSTLTVSEVDD